MKRKKRILQICAVLLILFFVIFFINIAYKKFKIGNNESNKSAEEIKEYILNMNSYKAKIEVTINSNKNTTKYLLEQEYSSNNTLKQTVLKPENIEGIEIIYKDGNMTINNSKLNLSKIYNNYPYLSNNVLWLNSFVDKYMECKDNANVYEENNEIVIELESDNNRYMETRRLYLEKGTGRPKKMVISDNNKKDIVYILYEEIDINK